jgi:hypothetical protein
MLQAKIDKMAYTGFLRGNKVTRHPVFFLGSKEAQIIADCIKDDLAELSHQHDKDSQPTL